MRAVRSRRQCAATRRAFSGVNGVLLPITVPNAGSHPPIWGLTRLLAMSDDPPNTGKVFLGLSQFFFRITSWEPPSGGFRCFWVKQILFCESAALWIMAANRDS